MTQAEKTTKLLNGLDFTNHDPSNLLECFYAASAEAQLIAEKFDVLQNHCYALWCGIQFGLNNIPIDTVNFMHDCDKARWQEENAKGTDT